MKKILLVLTIYSLYSVAQTNRIWTGLGANNNWSNSGNWSGGVVPTSNDTVIFNSTSLKNCTLNNPATITVAKFVIENSYTGIITQNTNRNISVGTDFIVNGGTFTPAGSGSITVTQNFILNGGSFTKSSSSMTVSNGDFIINGGSFNKGSGGNLTITQGDFVVNNGVFNMGAAGNLTVTNGGILLYGGEFIKTSTGNISSTTNNITIDGGEFNSTGSGGTITLTNSGIEIFSGKFKSGSETINSSGGSIYIEGGEFESANSTINVQDVILVDGTIKLNTSTFTTSSFRQESGEFVGGSGKHSFGIGGVDLAGGVFNYSTDTTTIRNTLINSGATLNHNNGTVIFNISPADMEVQDVGSFYNLLIQNIGTGAAPRTLTINSSFNVLNSLSLTSGSGVSTRRIILNGSPINLSGNLIINGTSTSNNINSGNSKIVMTSSIPRSIKVNSTSSRSKFVSSIEINSPSNVSIEGKLALTGDLVVNSGASLTLSNDTLLLNGNLTVDGNLNHNFGTVTFFKQVNAFNEINGSSSVNLNNVNIWRTGTFPTSRVDQYTEVSLIGSLDFSNASSRYNTNGNPFTLLSTDSLTGRIGVLTNTNQFVGGPITVQRYIPASSGRFWYHFGSPVNDAPMSNIKATYTDPSAQDPDPGIFINGNTIANSSPAIPALGISNGNTPSVFQFNPNSTSPWIAPTDVNANMSNQYGYRFFIRDGNATIAPTTGAKLLSFTGGVRKMSQTYTLLYQENGGSPISDGWVYLTNPYPSDISGNLNKSGAYTHTGLSFTTVYLWDAPNGNWRTRTPTDSSQFTNIPSSKAFMIRVSPSGGSLTINEQAKVRGNASFSREEPVIANYLTIKLQNNTSNIYDITSLKYDSSATKGFDSDMDAYKLTFSGGNSPTVIVNTYIDGLPASINNKPGFDIYGDTTQLYVNCPNGLNTLSFMKTDMLPDTVDVSLIDRFTGNETDIRSNPVYEFQVTSDTLSKFNRFQIVFKPKEKVTSLISSGVLRKSGLYPNPNYSGIFYLQSKYQNVKRVDVYNSFGAKVATLERKASDNAYQLPEGTKQGVYLVKIQSDNLTYTEKLILQ